MKESDWKTALRLLLWFAKIGCFTFGGGWGILAQMEQEFIERRGLITKDDLLDLLAVGKTMPGIMITNISMLFGYQLAGVAGGVCAVIGIAIPAVVILSIVTVFYNQLRDNYWFDCALRGVGCAVVPIIGGAALSMGQSVFKTVMGCVICAVAAALCIFTDIGNITLVAVGVVIALARLAWNGRKGGERHGVS